MARKKVAQSVIKSLDKNHIPKSRVSKSLNTTPRATVKDLDPRIVRASQRQPGPTVPIQTPNTDPRLSQVAERNLPDLKSRTTVKGSGPRAVKASQRKPNPRVAIKIEEADLPVPKPKKYDMPITGRVNTDPQVSPMLRNEVPAPTQTENVFTRRPGPHRPPTTKTRSSAKSQTEWEKVKASSEKVKGVNKEIADVEKQIGSPLPKGTAFKSIKDIGEQAWDGVKGAGLAGGDYLGSAITGAVVGGTIGGVNEWANGGSFTGGFKSGMMSGAVGGAAFKGVRTGAYGSKYANHSLGDAVGKHVNRFNESQYVNKSKVLNHGRKKSKALTELERLNSTSQINR